MYIVPISLSFVGKLALSPRLSSTDPGEGDGLTEELCELDGETEADGLTEALGDTLGLFELEGEGVAEIELEGDTEADGLTEAEGLTLGDCELEGLTEGLWELEGLTDPEGETDGDSDELPALGEGESELEGETEADGLTDPEGETDALCEIDADGLTEALGETEAEGLTLGDCELDGETDGEGEEVFARVSCSPVVRARLNTATSSIIPSKYVSALFLPIQNGESEAVMDPEAVTDTRSTREPAAS